MASHASVKGAMTLSMKLAVPLLEQIPLHNLDRALLLATLSVALLGSVQPKAMAAHASVTLLVTAEATAAQILVMSALEAPV